MTEISTTTLPAAPAQPSVPRLTIPRRLGAPAASPASAPETAGSAAEASPDAPAPAESVAALPETEPAPEPKRRGRPKGSSKKASSASSGDFGFRVAVVAPPFELHRETSAGRTTTQDVAAEGDSVILSEGDSDLQSPISAIALTQDAARALHAWLGAYCEAMQAVAK